MENDQNKELLLNAHLYLVKISQVEEREVFKICLEYWAKLVAELYEEIQSVRTCKHFWVSVSTTRFLLFLMVLGRFLG